MADDARISYLPVPTADDVPDEEVINAIKSVPCHY